MAPKILLTALALALAACATTPPPSAAPAPAPSAAAAPRAPDNFQLDMLNAVVWSRTAAEAEATHLQVFETARRQLDAALADKTWTAAVEQTGNFAQLPPAVVVDVDDTMLDTTDYMVERARVGDGFSKASWNAYVQLENAPPIPGALKYLQYAASKGVTVFYVSNREVAVGEFKDEVEPTRRNLNKLGFPNTTDSTTFLFRDTARGWKDKSPRRAHVAKTHRIVQMVGDNLYDLIDVPNATRELRDAAVEQRVEWLGTRWFMVANPMYGSWEQVITNGAAGAEGRRLKLESVGVPGALADRIANGGFEK
jgi:acid phosphatase